MQLLDHERLDVYNLALDVASAASRSSLRLQHGLDLRPLLFSQLCPHHRDQMEHTIAAMEIACTIHSKFRRPQKCPPRIAGHGHGHGHVYGREFEDAP